MKNASHLLLSLALTVSSIAATKPDIEPALLHPEGESGLLPAVRLAWNPKYRPAPKNGWQKHWELDLKSTLATKSRAHDEPTVVDFRGGTRWDPSGSRGPTNVFGGGTAAPPKPAFPGSIGAELAAAFEGDQPLDNRQWATGLRLNYTPDDRPALRRAWHPYIWLEYRWVSESGSTVADRLGVPMQDYWRFGGRVHWQIALSELGADGFWSALKVVPGFRYYRSTDLEFSAGDLADAWYYSLDFDYALPAAHRWLSAIRVGISDGRLPPATESQTMVSVAFAVKWDSLFSR